MFVKIFDLIKESIIGNKFLAENINYYGFLELDDDVPMPHVLFSNFKSNNVYSLNGDLFCLKINFSLLFSFNDYDECLFDKIVENINLSIRYKSYFQDNLYVELLVDDLKSYRENNIFTLNYSFSGVVFSKNNFLY